MVCERANRRRNPCDACADEYEKMASVASLNNTVQRTVCFKIKIGDNNMKALVYNGPRDVRVMDVPDAKIELSHTSFHLTRRRKLINISTHGIMAGPK